MKRLSTKGTLLFAVTIAACAFVVQSPAMAASWGVVGTEHTLDSPNFGYTTTIGGLGTITSSCRATTFTVTVTSAARMTITQARFDDCTGSGEVFGRCTITKTATGLPWQATAVSTTEVEIHGIDWDELIEDHPDLPGGCAPAGIKSTFTGTVRSGDWTGNGANQHEIVFNDDPGIVRHDVFGAGVPVTLRGTFRDTQQTLTVTG